MVFFGEILKFVASGIFSATTTKKDRLSITPHQSHSSVAQMLNTTTVENKIKRLLKFEISLNLTEKLKIKLFK